MIHRFLTQLPSLGLILIPLDAASAAAIDSEASGNWNDINTWVGDAVPQTGAGDTAGILAGHTVIYTSTAPFAGLDGSNDFGVGNGNTININGGVLTQAMDGWWVRIGHKGIGTLNINDGRFHVTDGTGGGTNLQVGVETNGNGTIAVGDGIGAGGSAVLNLRDRVDGSLNGGSFSMNLAANVGTVGKVTVNADGVLQGDQRTWNGTAVAQNPHIRIGQSDSSLQSELTVNSGGQFNARGNVEVASAGNSKGHLRLTGSAARMDMTDGELTIGYTGAGFMTVENNAVFSRINTVEGRSDLFLGRNAAGVGTLTIASGGEFRRGSGGNIGDLRIGLSGKGTVNVETGGLFHNESGNWDWLGQGTGSTGTINVNGGTFEITSGSNLIVGVDGTGVFTQNSGTTNLSGIRSGVNAGSGLITIAGGTVNIRAGIYLGGDSGTSGGTGTATLNQTGGETTVAGALVVGIAANHTGILTLAGGTINHTGSDTSVGESGTGTLRISSGATLTETTVGQFFVGRNEGSRGTLVVDGNLTKTGSVNPIRVGNGNPDGADNTTAPGLLGGSGSILTGGGVRIGSRGTITGGLTTTVGTLEIIGDLAFSADGQYACQIGGATADRLTVDGALDITGATLAIDALSAPTATSYVIASYTSTLTGTFTGTGIPAGYQIQHDEAAKQIKLVKSTATGFATWAGTNGLSGSATADFDKDGISDGAEYVLGTDPKVPSSGGPSIATSASAMTVTFTRDHRSLTSDIALDVEVSPNLATWTNVYHVGPVGGASAAEVTVADQGTFDTITVTLPRGSDAMKFARLRVTLAP